MKLIKELSLLGPSMLIAVFIFPLILGAQTGFFQEPQPPTQEEIMSMYPQTQTFEVPEFDPEDIGAMNIDDFNFNDMFDSYQDVRNSDFVRDVLRYYGVDRDAISVFEVNITPETVPGPNEKVELRVRTNVKESVAMFVWSINGEVVEEGYGLNRYSFTTGEIGESHLVQVRMTASDGRVSVGQMLVTPAEVDIYWQANTYAPVQYKGKRLSPRADNGTLDFVAMPKFTDEGLIEDPNKYIFSWTVNGIRHSAGRGRDTLSLDLSDYPKRVRIGLTVEPVVGGRSLIKEISFPNQGEPEVLLYKKDLYGVDYSRAVNYTDEFQMRDESLSIKMEPLFFTAKQKDALLVKWFMNREPIPDFENDTLVNFAVDRDFTGVSEISVSVKNESNIRERSDSDLTISVERSAMNF